LFAWPRLAHHPPLHQKAFLLGDLRGLSPWRLHAAV
jgi:hypothetical protein